MVWSLFRRFAGARPDRRRGPRGTPLDGRIGLAGQYYALKDWSRRGFSVVGVGPHFYPGDHLVLSVEVVLAEERLSFDCRAVVVWVDRERKELAGVFTDLDLGVQERIMRDIVARAAAGCAAGAPQHA